MAARSGRFRARKGAKYTDGHCLPAAVASGRAAGPSGVVLATFPFVFTHLGKPELETLSTFFGGLGFGWIAWRTRSVLYGALLHAYLISLMVLVASA